MPLGTLQSERSVARGHDVVAAELQQSRQTLQRIVVVIGKQDSAFHGVTRLGRGGRRAIRDLVDETAVGRLRGRKRIGVDREPDDELAALAHTVAVRGDASPVHLDEPAHQGKPDAEAALGMARRAVELREQVEYHRQQIGGDAFSRVGHPDGDFGAIAAYRDRDTPAPLRVLGCIAQHVAQSLRQARRIAEYLQRLSGHIDGQIVRALGEHRMSRLDRPRDEIRDFVRLFREVDLAARDARDIQQVIDESRQVRNLPLDDIPRPAELRILDRLTAH